MEIVLLGTSGALPTRLRYPSSIALVREGEVLLFDCGEGAQIQFQKAQLKPGKLTRIFISHFHGDHFYGLIGLLTSLQLGGRWKPLSIYGPLGLARYLAFLQEISHLHFNYVINVNEIDENDDITNWNFGDYHVTARPLEHSLFVLGFAIEEKAKPGKFDVKAAEELGVLSGPLRGLLQSGKSVVLPNGVRVEPYSVLGPERPGKKIAVCLDTKPCQNAIDLARNADLLIHDGTFEQSKREWARETGHSTVAQAAEIAKQAGVEKLVLTHISARYKEEHEETLLSQAQKVFPNSFIGRDLMRIPV